MKIFCKNICKTKMLHQGSCYGFTLIELLIVIAIIGILSSVVLSSLNSARQKARTAQRIMNMNQVQKALEMYYNDNGAYPSTYIGYRASYSECPFWFGGYAPEDVIPGLVPTYLPEMPSDPSMDKPNNNSCYVYSSDGKDYAFMDTRIVDPGFSFVSRPSLIDPWRDGFADCSVNYVNPNTIAAWKVYSPGGCSW